MELNLHRKKVFVCHVKTGYQDREQHITQMLGRMKMPFEFITEGDIADLTPEVLNHYFGWWWHEKGRCPNLLCL